MNGTQEDNAALFCSTDRKNCCIDELNISGRWLLPNGTKIPNTHINSVGNQAVGLSIMNMADLSSGIYHCEMMDREDVTHHLYAGIYPEGEGMWR